MAEQIERAIYMLDHRTTGVEKIAESTRTLEANATSQEKVTRATRVTEEGFARLQARIDPAVRAHQQYQRTIEAVGRYEREGIGSAQERAQVIQLATTRYNEQVGALNKVVGANDNFTKSTGLARYELINLSRQAQDVGVSLLSGQSPFTVLVQQGTQIADVFASSTGSVRGFLGQVAGVAARVLPVAAALGAVATALYAANRAADQSREARIATTSGLGRLSGVTGPQIGDLATRAVAPGLSLGDAREGVLEFVKAGANAQTIATGMGQALQFAATKGIDLSQSFKELASAAGNPAEAIIRLNAQFRLWTDAEIAAARTLQNAGQFAEAAAIIFNKLPKALVAGKDATTLWQREFAAFNTTLSQSLDLLADFAKRKPPTIQTEAGERLRSNLGPATAIRGETPRTASSPDANKQLGAGTASSAAAEARAERSKGLASLEKQVNDILEEQERRRANIKKQIDDINAALADDVNVMKAITTEEKARAEAARVRNEEIRKTGMAEKDIPKDTLKVINTQASAAATRIKEQEAAATRQAIVAQQVEIGMYDKLAGAARMQGLAGVQLNAQLQAEIQFRGANGGVLSKENAARAENAGVMARQAVQLRDIAQATEARASGSDQVELIKLETATLGQDEIVRTRRLSIMQGEIQARALERQGLSDAASATRSSSEAIANEVAARDRRIAKMRQATEAAQAEAQAIAMVNAEFERIGGGANSFSAAGSTVTNFEEFKRIGSRGQATVGTPGGAGGSYTSSYDPGNVQAITRINEAVMAAQQGKKDAAEVAAKAATDAATQNNTRLLSLTSSRLSDAISALNDQKSKLDEKVTQYEGKVDAGSRPDRPDPYLDHNPDYFYRNGTAAWKEDQAKDPINQLLAEAKAQRDGIDRQIEQLQEQANEASRQSELLSAGVTLSAQEVAGIQTLIGVVSSIGTALQQSDFSRMLAASNAQTTEQQQTQQTNKGQPTIQRIPVGLNGGFAPVVTYAGKFADGGFIPPGMWGWTGERGPERVYGGQSGATVVPLRRERPIQVQQTIVVPGGDVRQVRQSRGEVAQRIAADVSSSMRQA